MPPNEGFETPPPIETDPERPHGDGATIALVGAGAIMLGGLILAYVLML